MYKNNRKIKKAKARHHPFSVLKRQFDHMKTRFRGLTKNTAQLMTLFALSSLWMARRQLLTHAGKVGLYVGNGRYEIRVAAKNKGRAGDLIVFDQFAAFKIGGD